MAARPAIDSLMPCISGASWEPVNSHCPIRRGPVSITVRTYASNSGVFWISSKTTGGRSASRNARGSLRTRA